MKKAILGKKVGMTQVFSKDGKAVPVTVIEAGPNVVIQKKTIENDGYEAIQVGFSDKAERKVTKPLRGHFAKAKVATKRFIREFRLEDISGYEIGQELKADVFAEGDKVDISGVSKGKGMQGTIKRYNASRGPMSHGSKFHRAPGSMGASSDPSRTFKGKKLPGHMGSENTTVINLEIIKVDAEKNYLLVKGGVPGIRGSLVMIKDSSRA